MSAAPRALLLLALLLVGGAGLSVAGRVPETEEPLSIAALPWAATDAPADADAPRAFLYVQAACPHCARAAHLVDSLRAVHALPVHIVAGDGRTDADAFAARARLAGRVIADSTRALARAAGIRAVPTLLVLAEHGGARRIVGAELPDIRRALRALETRR